MCDIPDDIDESLIRPSNWNDFHDIDGIVQAINGILPDNDGNIILPPQSIDCGTFN
jgi:hypothetical protein